MNLHHFRNSRLLRWLFRFRKRCGYGIHSPFAFNLVTGVIYEEGEYYAYSDLTKLAADFTSKLRLKDNRLLFRLVNNQEPNHGIIFAPDLGLTEYYLRYARKSCDWCVINSPSLSLLSKKFNTIRNFDFLYIDAAYLSSELWKLLLDHVYDHSLIVIYGIHMNDTSFDQWSNYISSTRVRVTFDLYDFGLIYFDKRLNKENYIINYY